MSRWPATITASSPGPSWPKSIPPIERRENHGRGSQIMNFIALRTAGGDGRSRLIHVRDGDSFAYQGPSTQEAIREDLQTYLRPYADLDIHACPELYKATNANFV